MNYTLVGVLVVLCYVPTTCYSQDTQDLAVRSNKSLTDTLSTRTDQLTGQLTDHAIKKLNGKYEELNLLVDRNSQKALLGMEKKEEDLRAKVQRLDSLKAVSLFTGIESKYQSFMAKLRTATDRGSINPLKEYIPRLDSMQTALRFLNQPGLAIGSIPVLQTASSQLQKLQASLQNANDIQVFLRQREQQLKDQLSVYPLGNKLLAINKEAYYYQAQLAQYKSVLQDPSKWQQAVLSAVRQSSAFQKFWQSNSYFSKLFPMPPDPTSPQVLTGLQTREQVQGDLHRRLGISGTIVPPAGGADGGGSGGGGYMQQQMQSAQSQLNALKARLSSLGGASSTMTMPDFQPNSQHTKTFLKRLQFGLSIQNTVSTNFLPAISNVGVNVGYKLCDKATAGVGGSYLVGLGYGFNHIQFSSQGVGLRSFLDIKFKGSFWISGGMEYTYLQQFASISDIRNVNVWQKSALIGLTKKYRIGKKENNLQLLYDFLADQEIPHGQAIQFRMGWGL